MTTFEAALGQLPKPILDKLQSMIRRVRRLILIRGLFATLAVALVSLLAIMAIDAAVTLFSTTARWVLSLAGLATTLLAAWWFLVRPLSRRFTLTHMARILEVRHPELQERISTAVELLASDDPESIRGSAELISAVVDSAVIDVAAVDPQTEFKPARSKKFILATALCGGVIALLFLIWPTQSWTLFARALAPFLDLGNAYAATLVIDPGNIRVAKGDPVTIQVSIKHKRLNRAEIRRRLPDGAESVERMTLVGEEDDGTKRFSVTFPSVEEGFNYRVRAGAALSQYYDVVTVAPPSVGNLTVNYDYPDYTGLPDAGSDTATGEIRAVAHTRVALTATLNEPAAILKMILNESTEVAPPVVEGNQATWHLELKTGLRGNWHLEIADADGFKNEVVTYPLEVLPDKAPTVRITQPTQSEIRLKPTERLPLDLEVIEGFGFAEVTLLVTPDGAIAPTEVRQALPTATGSAGTYAARVILDLPALKLAPEQQRLALQVRVRDNRPSEYDGPGVGLSEVIFVTLDQAAKSLADQAIEAQRQEIGQQIKEAKQELERARDDLRRTEQELNRAPEMNDQAKQKLKDFTEHNKAAREKLEQVAATLDTPLFREQSRQAEKLARESLAEAQEKADMIPVTDLKEDRLADAKGAREKVEESIRDLDKLALAMRAAEKDYKAISKLNELANRQQELALKAEDWSEKARSEAKEMAAATATEEAQKQFSQQQQREAEQFRSEQNRVEQQLGEMLKDNAAALSEVLKEQRRQSETLAKEAGALALQQEALREANKSATEKSADQQNALREALLDQLAARQSQVAAETKEALSARADKADPTRTAADEQQPEAAAPAPGEAPAAAAGALAKAASETSEAAAGLAERHLDEAMKAAKEAGDSLAQAAANESTPPPTAKPASTDPTAKGPAQPDSTPPVGLLSDLALRQETLARQIEAIHEGKLQEALAMMESQLETSASALTAQAKGLELSLQNLQQNQAKSRANQAQKALDEGARKAAESASQLNRAQEQQAAAAQKEEVAEGQLSAQAKATMQQGQTQQQKSAQSLAQASTAFTQSAESIGQTMEGLEPAESDERLASKEELAEGFDDVSKSSKSQTAEQAASQAQQAANSLQQLAQTAMKQLGGSPQGKTGEPDGPPKGDENQEMAGDPDSPDLNETGKKTADMNGDGLPPELQNLGISAEDWARFKGALVGGNATAIETELPAEYRELVGRYFQVIAKEAGKK